MKNNIQIFYNFVLAEACHPERSEGPHTIFVPHPNLLCVINQRRRGPSVRAGLVWSARLGKPEGAVHHFSHA
jgi:hypothetical protein